MFSDIGGSTQRWERDRAAMQDAVRRHDTLLRTAIVERNGHVFKTIGDAFCAAFARADGAAYRDSRRTRRRLLRPRRQNRLSATYPERGRVIAEALATAKASGANGWRRKSRAISLRLSSGGDSRAALRLAGEALVAFRARSDTRGIATSLSNMAAYHIALKRYDEARAHAREALVLFRDVQSEVRLLFTLQHLGAVEALQYGRSKLQPTLDR